LPVWQTIYSELSQYNFSVFSIMEDKNIEDARPWIEKSGAKFPCTIDTNHIVSDLYNMFNVPTVVWIDENGKIVRPNDVVVMNEGGAKLVKVDPETYIEKIRRWVINNDPPMNSNDDFIKYKQQREHTDNEQVARAEFLIGQWLYNNGELELATQHFETATELSPADVMIQRGTMSMRGMDPMKDYGPIAGNIIKKGLRLYRPIRD
jgi:hypothetical protein